MLNAEREQEIRDRAKQGRGVQDVSILRDLLAEIDRLRADQERLKVALRGVLEAEPFIGWAPSAPTADKLETAFEQAREVLAGVSGSPEREE